MILRLTVHIQTMSNMQVIQKPNFFEFSNAGSTKYVMIGPRM